VLVRSPTPFAHRLAGELQRRPDLTVRFPAVGAIINLPSLL
jgi:hypothetical protein